MMQIASRPSGAHNKSPVKITQLTQKASILMSAGIDPKSQENCLGDFPRHRGGTENRAAQREFAPDQDYLMALCREYSCLCGFATETKPSNPSDGNVRQTPLEEGLKPRYILRCWESWGVSEVQIQVGVVLEKDAPYCLMPPGLLYGYVQGAWLQWVPVHCHPKTLRQSKHYLRNFWMAVHHDILGADRGEHTGHKDRHGHTWRGSFVHTELGHDTCCTVRYSKRGIINMRALMKPEQHCPQYFIWNC